MQVDMNETSFQGGEKGNIGTKEKFSFKLITMWIKILIVLLPEIRLIERECCQSLSTKLQNLRLK